MPTLTRNDGVEFVIQAYRELTENGNKAALLQKIRALAEQHGRFVRLFKKENHYFEAVFSNEAGYLLGESVKHYFYQAQNLIFCEALEDLQHVLLVVVRDGEVYLDTIINKQLLRQELRLLISDQYQYQIFTHGDVPLIDDPILPPEKIISFEKLSDPLLPRLPTLKNLQLLPLPMALKNQHLHGKNQTILYLAISIIALAGGWVLYDIGNHLEQQTPSISANVNPYADYNNALESAEPHAQLTEIMQIVELLYTIPGWQMQSLSFNNKHYLVKLKNTNGDTTQLQQWGNFNNFSYQLNDNQPSLTKLALVPSRMPPKTISNENALIAAITTQLGSLLGAEQISIGNALPSGATKQTLITLTIQEGTPKILDIIGQILANQPVMIQSAELENKGLTLSGKIQFSIWGN